MSLLVGLHKDVIDLNRRILAAGGLVSRAELVALTGFVEKCVRDGIYNSIAEFMPWIGDGEVSALRKLKFRNREDIYEAATSSVRPFYNEREGLSTIGMTQNLQSDFVFATDLAATTDWMMGFYIKPNAGRDSADMGAQSDPEAVANFVSMRFNSAEGFLHFSSGQTSEASYPFQTVDSNPHHFMLNVVAGTGTLLRNGTAVWQDAGGGANFPTVGMIICGMKLRAGGIESSSHQHGCDYIIDSNVEGFLSQGDAINFDVSVLQLMADLRRD